MNEWIKVINDAYQALSQAEARLQELRERFKNTKKKIYHLNIFLANSEIAKERALVAYSTHPSTVSYQEDLIKARENVARGRQDLADMEALMEAAKGEYRFLRKEIPVLQQAMADAEKLFWFGVYEGLQERIRKSIGDEVHQAYAAYSATFAHDLTYSSFLKRLFPDTLTAQHQADIRKELAKVWIKSGPDAEEETNSLSAPAPGGQEVSLTPRSEAVTLTPSEEARQWAALVRG